MYYRCIKSNNKECNIPLDNENSQEISDIKLLRNNVYYSIDMRIKVNFYEISKQCGNKGDNEDLVITMKSSEPLEGYTLIINSKSYQGTFITEYIYDYTISNENLSNGDYFLL